VLLVSPSAKPGGAERVFAALARELPRHGIETHAALLEHGELEDWLRRDGVPSAVVAAGRTRQVHRFARTVAHLRSLARDADAVVTSTAKGHLYGGLAAAAARRPAVWWQHDVPRRNPFQLAAARVPAAAVVCVSDAVAHAQRRATPRRRVVTIPNGLPIEQIRAAAGRDAIRAELGWNGSPVVGIVGRLQPWKGQETFLRAAARVADTHPSARFAVVGGAILGWEGDYPQRLETLAGELGLGERVHFAGHQADSWSWLDACDVVVHASSDEPFGLVVVEAMALGKPVVAAAEGGPAEVVESERSGLLVPPRQPELLAAAVQRVLDDEQLSARLRAGARERAEAFSEELMAQRFAELLSEVRR
jgi:glycosyltransferase involved in cell wall biosynthesis